MPRHKDTVLTAKIFALKQSGLSNAKIARQLNINPMTVGKHVKSTEYESLAHSLARDNAENQQKQIQATHAVIMATTELKDNIFQCEKCGKVRETPLNAEEMAKSPLIEPPNRRDKKQIDNRIQITVINAMGDRVNVRVIRPLCPVCDIPMQYLFSKPSKEAQMMARTIGNTQTSRLLSTKADNVAVSDKSLEDKERLLKEIMEDQEDDGGTGGN